MPKQKLIFTITEPDKTDREDKMSLEIEFDPPLNKDILTGGYPNTYVQRVAASIASDIKDKLEA